MSARLPWLACQSSAHGDPHSTAISNQAKACAKVSAADLMDMSSPRALAVVVSKVRMDWLGLAN